MSSVSSRMRMGGAAFVAVLMLWTVYPRTPPPVPLPSAHDTAARELRSGHARRPPPDCPTAGGCEAARRESFNFFSDIVDDDWIRLKERFAETPNHHLVNGQAAVPWRWYQDNWEPSFTCQHERRVGGTGDGPKWVCDPHRIEPKRCLVYSIGSFNLFDFEESVLREISETCEIHTFDPNIPQDEFVGPDHPSRKPDGVQFHPWGLATDNFVEGNKVFKNMQQIVKDLGHEGRAIDMLKIDCEGCEWETYKGWFGHGVDIRQVQVELHEGTEIGWFNSGDSVEPVADRFFAHLQSLGYVVFHKEPNTWGCRGKCIEYAFLKLAKEFQQR